MSLSHFVWWCFRILTFFIYYSLYRQNVEVTFRPKVFLVFITSATWSYFHSCMCLRPSLCVFDGSTFFSEIIVRNRMKFVGMVHLCNTLTVQTNLILDQRSSSRWPWPFRLFLFEQNQSNRLSPFLVWWCFGTCTHLYVTLDYFVDQSSRPWWPWLFLFSLFFSSNSTESIFTIFGMVMV